MRRSESAKRRREQIEQEFGEPFEDIIRGYREQGATWETIAGSLEVSEATLRGWVRKLGLLDQRRNVEITPSPPSLNDRAKALGYKGVTDMIIAYYKQGKRMEAVQKDLACSNKIYRYLPEELHGQQFKYPSEKALAWRNRNPTGNWSKRLKKDRR